MPDYITLKSILTADNTRQSSFIPEIMIGQIAFDGVEILKRQESCSRGPPNVYFILLMVVVRPVEHEINDDSKRHRTTSKVSTC